jgi:phage tail-like protein
MDESIQSKTLQYLPAIFQRKPAPGKERTVCLGQFLLPFEKVIDSFEEVLAVVDRFFAPSFTPAQDFLPWLATWIALVLDEEWDEDKRRRLLGEAMELYQWRGTVHGMKRYLEIYTGLGPDDIDIRESRRPAGMQIGVTSRIAFKASAPPAAPPPDPVDLFHRHPQAALPPDKRRPNIARCNELVDFVDSPSQRIDTRTHDYYLVDTLMPTDLPPGTDPSKVPASGPIRIIYRAEMIEQIKLEDTGVSVRYRPRAPETYPNDTLVGGTLLIGEMEQAYCFIVDIHGLIPSLDEVGSREEAEKRLSKIRVILDAEKPAHTEYYLRLTPSAIKSKRRFMQVGVRSSIGLDTTLS